jgi:hypothetical protein
LFPRCGALFKYSHNAASPTSSDPKNSKNPSSGASAADAGGLGDPVGGGAGGGGPAFAIAQTAFSNSQPLPELN